MNQSHAQKHLHWFIAGYLMDHFQKTGQQAHSPEFDDCLRVTIRSVTKHLTKQGETTTPLSPIQYKVVQEVKAVFGENPTFL